MPASVAADLVLRSSDHGHRRLLRASGERQGSGRTAEKRDELPPPHAEHVASCPGRFRLRQQRTTDCLAGLWGRADLLQHKEVIDRVERRGGKPKLVFLMFDENTEKLAKELGWQVWFPKAKLRKFQLTDRSKAWINGIRRHFQARPLTAAARPRWQVTPSRSSEPRGP